MQCGLFYFLCSFISIIFLTPLTLPSRLYLSDYLPKSAKMIAFSFGQVLQALGYILAVSIIGNIFRQLLFRDRNAPPVVFHWIPFLGNTISYGIAPYDFFFACRRKYGDIFTFVLLGQKTTVYLGPDGNEFILNGKLRDVNAEEIYSPLCTPVFGSDVVYDCPNAKLMEQKKFVKFGLTQEALESHVQLIEAEVIDYIQKSPNFAGKAGTFEVPAAMAEVTIFTAARALQGEEVRSKLTTEFAELYHDLDKGFSPINFMLPWAPLPHNRKRDQAHAKMREVYMDIIRQRRESGKETPDMIWNLMQCKYKKGTPVPDVEICHMMITILMAGQHSSASISSWIVLRLACDPEVTEQLYQEQKANLNVGADGTFPPLQYAHLDKLPLHQCVIKETLRLHSSIHSLMRKVKNTMPVPGTQYVVPRGHVLLASPGVTALSDEYFPNAQKWDPARWMNRVEEEDDTDMVDYGYGTVSKGTRSPYLPFGAGRHRCIGEKFAYVQLGVLLAVLVRNFRFYNIEGKEGVPATDYSSLFSKPKQPAPVRFERR